MVREVISIETILLTLSPRFQMLDKEHHKFFFGKTFATFGVDICLLLVFSSLPENSPPFTCLKLCCIFLVRPSSYRTAKFSSASRAFLKLSRRAISYQEPIKTEKVTKL